MLVLDKPGQLNYFRLKLDEGQFLRVRILLSTSPDGVTLFIRPFTLAYNDLPYVLSFTVFEINGHLSGYYHRFCRPGICLHFTFLGLLPIFSIR